LQQGFGFPASGTCKYKQAFALACNSFALRGIEEGEVGDGGQSGNICQQSSGFMIFWRVLKWVKKT
jgi:hypothetical protein